MIVPNKVGVVVTEALKTLKKPVPLTELISKVATILECPQQQVADLVTEAVKGGVHYGYIQQSRERYAYFPINISGLTDDDNLYTSQKKKSRNSLSNYPKTTSRVISRYRASTPLLDIQSDLKITAKRSVSTCVYNRSKDRDISPSASTCVYNRSKHRDVSPSIQSAPFANVRPTTSNYRSLNLRRDNQASQPKLKTIWRI